MNSVSRAGHGGSSTRSAGMSPATSISPIQGKANRFDLRAFNDLIRLRLTLLVLFATGGAYVLAFGERLFTEPSRFGARLGVLLATVLGTALVSSGASVFNQVWEWRIDARMERTRSRPIPSGKIPPRNALIIATLLTFAGLSVLCGTANSVSALLALTSLLLYLLVYTPLKRRMTQNTLVGAIPGAIPPLIGWSAATGGVEAGGWVLFAIVFVWQVPHFLAIAWTYREDYARGGFKMLPIQDEEGSKTARMSLLYAVALVPVTLVAPLNGLGGPVYTIGATVLGLALIAAALAFVLKRTRQRARQLFLASVVYLPALFLLMIVDVPGS